MREKPNVIVVISHDTGRFVRPYGVTTVNTPACDRLAEEGVVFDGMFCTAPQCSPSRAGLFTGRAPHATGVHGLTHRPFDFDIRDGVRHAASYFRELGYRTFAAGSCHETHSLDRHGFDAIERDRNALTMPDAFKDWLGTGDGPFFAELSTFQTHRPFPTDEIPPDDSLGVTVTPPLEPTAGTIADFAALQGSVKQWDTGLGRLLDILDTEGLTENTLLFVTSDHGVAMPLAKATLFDRGIGVLGFMRYPAGGVSGGRRYPEMLSNLDVLPTLLEAAGGLDAAGRAHTGGTPESESAFHGRSFLPLLQDRPYEANSEIFAELTYHGYYKPMRCVRTDRYKYIRHFSPAVNHMVPSDVMRGGAYRDNLDLILGYRRTRYEELFDLTEDRDETVDLLSPAGEAADQRAGRRQAAAVEGVREDLSRRLAVWMRETGDPILDGGIPSPSEHSGREEMRRLSGL